MSEENVLRFLRLPEVLQRTGLSRDSVYRMARRGEFPKPHKISARASGWLDAEIAAWIESRTLSGAELVGLVQRLAKRGLGDEAISRSSGVSVDDVRRIVAEHGSASSDRE
jgi:prophage regulatory protein